MLLDVCNQIEGNTICAHGDAAAWPIQGMLKKFMPEIMAHIENGCCPYEDSDGHGGSDWDTRGQEWLDQAGEA